jgi:hypothetical protein
MLEINESNQVKSTNTESVTFKISVSEKNKLLIEAKELGMSLSEYLRIKVSIDNNGVKELIIQNNELKQKIKENTVKNRVPSIQNADETSIVLQSTKTGKKVLGQLLFELKYRNKLFPRCYYQNDNEIATGLSVVIAEYCTDTFGDLPEIRNRYKITRWEDYYRLLFKPYYEKVFSSKDELEY